MTRDTHLSPHARAVIGGKHETTIVGDYYDYRPTEKPPAPLGPNFFRQLFDALVKQYQRYYTAHFIHEDRSRRDCYVELTLKNHFDGRVVNPDMLPRKSRLIYLQGEAGSGKTTWCQRQAKQWAEGKCARGPKIWDDFDWVLFIPLARLQAKWTERQKQHQHLTRGELWKIAIKDPSITAESLEQYLLNSNTPPDKVLFLLDGLDEINRDPLFEDFLTGLLNCGTCLFSGRPQAFILRDQRVDVAGFF